MQRDVNGCEGDRRGGGDDAQWQRGQDGIVVRVTEVGDAMTAAGAGVCACRYNYAVHLERDNKKDKSVFL